MHPQKFRGEYGSSLKSDSGVCLSKCMNAGSDIDGSEHRGQYFPRPFVTILAGGLCREVLTSPS